MKFKLIYIFLYLLSSTFSFAGNFVTVDISAPENVKAGAEFIINVNVQKNDISGFAKFELYLPVGFKPQVIESASATFVYQAQLLKFIWIELPEKQTFNLSISIAVDYRIDGYKEIYGNFYYISNKERKKNSFRNCSV